jgi:hypothetical protein
VCAGLQLKSGGLGLGSVQTLGGLRASALSVHI